MKNSLHKSLVVPVAVSAIVASSLGSANADVVLGGPGMPIGSYKLTEMQDQVQVSLGNYYRYEVHGYYGRLDAGKPSDGWIGTTGQIYSNSTPSTWTGTKLTMTCTLTGQVRVGNQAAGNALELVAGNVLETTGDVTVARSSVLVFEDQDVTLNFQLDSNVTNPAGYLVIMGIGVKQPPKPSGELTVPVYAERLTNPDIAWTIDREISAESEGYDSTMTIVLPDYDSEDITPIDDVVDDIIDTVDDGWVGTGKTNNGHGNNVDGIDVSNPGKGKGGPNGMTDTVTDGVILDDESTGGGAAPSLGF